MAPDRPDSEVLDVLVEGDRITQIGRRLDPAGADIVDLAGRVVIPGLVNAHLHTWQTAMRFVGTDWSLPEYLANAHGAVAHRYSPDDMYVGTLAGALNQIDGGVTTIGDWCHNCVTPEHADAGVDALTRAGVRAVFLHGTPHSVRERPHDTGEVDRLLRGPIGASDLLSMGMAVEGPQLSKPEVAIADLRAAAERGILASMHQSAGPPNPGWRAVGVAGLWGPGVNIVHGVGLTGAWVQRLADAGVSLTSTPENELGQGHCTSLTRQLLRIGTAPSLGTDTEIATPGEVLVAARITLALQRGHTHDLKHQRTGLGTESLEIRAKQALSWVTIEGARALGLADRIGRIQPGLQADLVVIDTRRLNLWPLHDPVAAALHAHPGNVESVMIGGIWRKRDHLLLETSIDDIKGSVQQSGGAIRQPRPPPGRGRTPPRPGGPTRRAPTTAPTGACGSKRP
ncbi:amidohydrolase family protein [Mycolicibacterium komossense]|uniref:Amidohydrolase family protein n=2 Tax=Mycolicibacterium komossense TaxID=1779 RepID=A0ABT3CEX2_9MYCO|nr:amidohydrolase family protein [Mycolicibacterium komossense]